MSDRWQELRTRLTARCYISPDEARILLAERDQLLAALRELLIAEKFDDDHPLLIAARVAAERLAGDKTE